MSIHTFTQKIKGRKDAVTGWAGERRQMLVYMAILAVTTVLAFYMGYIARAESVKASPVVINCPLEAYMSPQAGSVLPVGPMSTASATGAYVASRNGAKYYPLGCGGVSRIKEENKVFFDTKASAEAAGYTPAQGCK